MNLVFNDVTVSWENPVEEECIVKPDNDLKGSKNDLKHFFYQPFLPSELFTVHFLSTVMVALGVVHCY